MEDSLVSPSDETVVLKPVQLQASRQQFGFAVLLIILRAASCFSVASLKAHFWGCKY